MAPGSTADQRGQLSPGLLGTAVQAVNCTTLLAKRTREEAELCSMSPVVKLAPDWGCIFWEEGVFAPSSAQTQQLFLIHTELPCKQQELWLRPV